MQVADVQTCTGLCLGITVNFFSGDEIIDTERQTSPLTLQLDST